MYRLWLHAVRCPQKGRKIKSLTHSLRVTGLCVGNSRVTGEFPAQMTSNAENGSIWWRHHEYTTKFICFQLELTHTRMYLINSFLLPIAMVCFRFLTVPFMYWKFGKHFEVSVYTVTSALPFEINYGAVGLIMLNLYRMTQQCPHTCGVRSLEEMYPDLVQPPDAMDDSALKIGYRQTYRNNKLKAGQKYGYSKKVAYYWIAKNNKYWWTGGCMK